MKRTFSLETWESEKRLDQRLFTGTGCHVGGDEVLSWVWVDTETTVQDAQVHTHGRSVHGSGLGPAPRSSIYVSTHTRGDGSVPLQGPVGSRE